MPSLDLHLLFFSFLVTYWGKNVLTEQNEMIQYEKRMLSTFPGDFKLFFQANYFIQAIQYSSHVLSAPVISKGC